MKKIIFSLLLLLSFNCVLAQDSADVALSFGPFPGFNGQIITMVEQPDGKILIGGNFTKYKGVTCKCIIRLNANGDVDTSFNFNPTTFPFNTWNYVTSIVIQPDGKIIFSGHFVVSGNSGNARVLRLNNDGSIDNTFNGKEFYYGTSSVSVNSIFYQTDGKILVIGGFDTYDSVARKNILRINSDGTLDTTFNPGSGFNELPTSLAIQTDGKIVAVGSFTNYNGYTRNGIIRLNSDASVDLSFSIGVGFDYSQNKKLLVLQPDGKIVVAGAFSKYKGLTEKSLIRLMPNGDNDPTLDIGSGFGPGGQGFYSLKDIKTDNLGNFIIGGLFSSYNGVQKYNCARIDTNGNLDTSFTISALPFTATNSPNISSILVQNDSKIILVGDNNYVSRFNNDSSKDNSFDYGHGFDNVVNALVIQSDGKIIVGGNFRHKNLENKNGGLIRLNIDGTTDTSFNSDYIITGSNTNKLLLQPDGKIIAIGSYVFAMPSTGSKGIIRLNVDGSLDPTFNPVYVETLGGVALQPDGKIVVMGSIYLGSQYYTGITRINSNGTYDNSFILNSINAIVNDIAVQPDGKIILVGDFTQYNGQQYIRIIRLLPNGNIDTSFNIGEGFEHVAYCVTLQPDGKILVGGYFGTYNLLPAWGIARINPNGSYDSTFNVGYDTNQIKSIRVQSDGKIIAGGYVSHYLGNPLKNLVRFNSNGSLDNSFDIGTGFQAEVGNSYINDIELQNDGKIVVAGNFINYKSVNSSMLVRLNGGNAVLSNENFLNKELTVYPNPTNDFINIQLPIEKMNFNYEIFDLTGKLLIQKTNYSNKIDVQSLSNGAYILKLNCDSKEYTSKFIKY